jgi:hypothetical protein
MKVPYFIPSLILLFYLTGCTDSVKKENIPLAQVYDKVLTKEEIAEITPNNLTGNDSIQFITNYINNWIKEQIIIHQAELNLKEEEKSFEKKLEQYRKSLLIYEFEKKLIEQKLDTNVTNEEIEKYYHENPQNFELKENIIQGIYIKVRNESPNIDKLKKWLFYQYNPENKQKIEEYITQFAEDFFINDSTSWVQFSDVIKSIPIKPYNEEDFLKKNKNINVSDSTFTYLLKINNYKIKNTLSPLSLEKNKIKHIIINKRKLLLIKKMERELYNNALKKNNIKIYIPEQTILKDENNS